MTKSPAKSVGSFAAGGPKADCQGCGTEVAFSGARYCWKCGYALRQMCPVCEQWNEVGGADLVDGRCKCGTELRACGVGCGRLHQGRMLSCNCGRGRALPRPQRIWSTANGPVDGRRCLRATGRLDSGSKPELYRTEGSFSSTVFDGLNVILISDMAVDVVSRGRRKLDHLVGNNPLALAADGAAYLIARPGLILIPYEAPPYLATEQQVIAHSLSDLGWVGLTANGEIINLGQWPTMKAYAGEQGVFEQGTMVSRPGSTLVILGDIMGAIEPNGWQTWSARKPVDLRYVFSEEGGSWWGSVPDGNNLRLVQLGPERIERQSQPIPMRESHPTIVTDGGEAFLLPHVSNGAVMKVRLSDGHVAKTSGRTPAGHLLHAVGVETSEGFRILMVAKSVHALKASSMDPETGHTLLLDTETTGHQDWDRAQWLITAGQIKLLVSNENTAELLSYNLS